MMHNISDVVESMLEAKMKKHGTQKSIYIRRPELYDKAMDMLNKEDSSMSEFVDMCLDMYIHDKLKIGCIRCASIKEQLQEMLNRIEKTVGTK